jgi:hypothetical protein
MIGLSMTAGLPQAQSATDVAVFETEPSLEQETMTVAAIGFFPMLPMTIPSGPGPAEVQEMITAAAIGFFPMLPMMVPSGPGPVTVTAVPEEQTPSEPFPAEAVNAQPEQPVVSEAPPAPMIADTVENARSEVPLTEPIPAVCIGAARASELPSVATPTYRVENPVAAVGTVDAPPPRPLARPIPSPASAPDRFAVVQPTIVGPYAPRSGFVVYNSARLLYAQTGLGVTRRIRVAPEIR